MSKLDWVKRAAAVAYAANIASYARLAPQPGAAEALLLEPDWDELDYNTRLHWYTVMDAIYDAMGVAGGREA